jgi:hypothetical protein
VLFEAGNMCAFVRITVAFVGTPLSGRCALKNNSERIVLFRRNG